MENSTDEIDLGQLVFGMLIIGIEYQSQAVLTGGVSDAVIRPRCSAIEAPASGLLPGVPPRSGTYVLNTLGCC